MFAIYIRADYINDKCEICGSDIGLELHHEEAFSELLKKTLEELNLTCKDTKEYSREELDKITNMMLGKQLRCYKTTLCIGCHIIYCRRGNNDLYYTKYYEKKAKLESDKNFKLIPYINSLIGKTLMKNDRDELINRLDIKKRGRLCRSISSIREYLKTHFNKKITSRRIKRKTVWIIEDL